MKDRVWRRFGAWRWGLFGALCAAVAAALLAEQVEQGLHDREMEMLRSQVRSAAVSCYASESRFPQDLSYLVENYGLVYDETRYIVHYDAFASNIMPDIDVSIRGVETP